MKLRITFGVVILLALGFGFWWKVGFSGQKDRSGINSPGMSVPSTQLNSATQQKVKIATNENIAGVRSGARSATENTPKISTELQNLLDKQKRAIADIQTQIGAMVEKYGMAVLDPNDTTSANKLEGLNHAVASAKADLAKLDAQTDNVSAVDYAKAQADYSTAVNSLRSFQKGLVVNSTVQAKYGELVNLLQSEQANYAKMLGSAQSGKLDYTPPPDFVPISTADQSTIPPALPSGLQKR